MADFVPSQKYASDFNKAKKYENGDAVQAETVNNLIEGQLFVQGIATNNPRVDEDNTEGQPIVYFENKDGLPRFVFKNIRGKDGKMGKKGDNGNIMRFTDSALYARSDAGTTLSISSGNLINGENVASGDVVLDTHYQEGENYYICIWHVTEVNVGATGTTVFLRGMDYIPSTGGGGTVKIEVDDALSETSENPVQNKAIALALGELEDDIETNANHISKEILRATAAEEALSKDIRGVEETLSEDISDVNALAQTNQGSISALNTKVQEIDDAYVNANEVKGFIDEALDNFKGDITVDMELSDTSIHPIANKTVTEALNGKLDKGTGVIDKYKVLVTDQNGKIISSSVGSDKLINIAGLTSGAQVQIDNINTNIGNLGTKVDEIDGVVDGHTLSLNGLKSRLNTVEANVDARAKTIEYSWESVGTDGVNPFKLNLTLKDANGNQLSTTQIDFPLEQMVVGAEYDKATKDLILYTTDGQVAIPVDDIFDGLATTTDLDTKLNKSGGWIYNTNTGSDTPLYVRADATASYIGYWDKAGTALGYFGFDANHNPKIYTTSRGYENVIHSGNIGSQNVAKATNVGTTWNCPTQLQTWSRICTIEGYSNYLINVKIDQSGEATSYVFAVGTGYDTANISQISSSGYPNPTHDTRVRLQRSSSSPMIFHFEMLNYYSASGSTVNVVCKAIKLSDSGILTPITTVTTNGVASNKEELYAHHNGVIVNSGNFEDYVRNYMNKSILDAVY